MNRVLRRARGAALAALLALGSPGLARAEGAEGVIVSMESEFAVVDIGATRGVGAGDVLEVWRTFKMKHPVTGRTIVDRFRIGALRVTQARPGVSVARVDGDVERTILQGDIVVAQKKEPPKAPPTAPAEAASPASRTDEKSRAESASPSTVTTTTTTTKTATPTAVAPPDPDAQELDALFRSLRGASPERRLAELERFVFEHPQSRHVEVLWDEARALKRLVDDERQRAERAAERPRAVSFLPPKTAPAGVPLRIGMELDEARGAMLHVRRRGKGAFTTTAMDASGPGYFGLTLPASMMREGTLEYFVESTSVHGDVFAVAGTAAAPLRVHVEDAIPPDTRAEAAPSPVVMATVLTDYASFNSKKANDTVWQSEAQLGVRMRDEGLRALRSGFGVYRGKGGTLEDLDERNLEARSVGLTYGYLEMEVALASAFALVGRGIVGLREAGVNGGAQGFVRIGNDRRTNILVGGEILGGIGLRGITQLEWNGFPRVPIVFRSEVTNQPAGVSSRNAGAASSGQGEVGVRSILQLGYRVVPRLVVAGRVSFQARTINHAGPGGGAAVIYEW